MKYTQIWYLLYSNTDPKSSQNMDYRVKPLDIAKYVVIPPQHHLNISTKNTRNTPKTWKNQKIQSFRDIYPLKTTKIWPKKSNYAETRVRNIYTCRKIRIDIPKTLRNIGQSNVLHSPEYTTITFEKISQEGAKINKFSQFWTKSWENNKCGVKYSKICKSKGIRMYQ